MGPNYNYFSFFLFLHIRVIIAIGLYKMNYFNDIKYSGINFLNEGFTIGEYENCEFTKCQLSQINLSGAAFIDCKFTSCDISNSKLTGTVFRDVLFKNSKLMGLHFQECSKLLLSVEFQDSKLNLVSFYSLKLHKMNFTNCELKEVDFTSADLTGSKFSDCNLEKSIFDKTNLTKSDLSTAYNYNIDPEKNKITKAKFSKYELRGLLLKYDITIID